MTEFKMSDMERNDLMHHACVFKDKILTCFAFGTNLYK